MSLRGRADMVAVERGGGMERSLVQVRDKETITGRPPCLLLHRGVVLLLFTVFPVRPALLVALARNHPCRVQFLHQLADVRQLLLLEPILFSCIQLQVICTSVGQS